MSVQSGREVVVECQLSECSTVKKKWEMHHGKYCSSECEQKHEGRKALADWKFEHTRCFTCFTRLKEIEPPKPDEAFDESGTGWAWDDDYDCWALERYDQEVTQEVAGGFQYRTPGADVGEKNACGNDKVTTGTICRHCGNTDHTLHVPYLVETDRVIERVLDYLREEDDRPVNGDQLRSTYVETDDLELAAGTALQ